MKKVISLILALSMGMSILTGCSNDAKPTGGNAGEVAPKKIAMICDPVGVNPFLTQVRDKLEEMSNDPAYNISYSVMECGDDTAWGENVRASVEEGYDLILGVGWQVADSLADVANQFPDKAKYIAIDTVCDSEYVKSYIFKPQEAAYLIGAVAALVSADAGKPNGPFGGVHANPGQGSFEWRYGYMEGAKHINSDIKTSDFIFNYTKSYTDAPIAKELALQQAAQGCVFINAASAVADFGTFEAALEKGFYTSGQDADRTSPDNANILTTQVKYTGNVTEMAILEFLSEEGVVPGVVSLGLAEGAVGAIYITDDGVNPRNTEVLTDEIVATVKEIAAKIISGEIVVDVPMEEDYK